MIRFILGLIFSMTVSAEEFQLKGHSFNSNSSIKTEHINVQPLKTVESPLPARDLREQHFKAAELEVETGKMDELDRDLFYYYVGEDDSDQLKQNFSHIDSMKIKKLKILITQSR